MTNLFLNILETSFYGSIVIVIILGLRLVLKKAPRGAICLLWLLAAMRLVCPFTIESSLSLQPSREELSSAPILFFSQEEQNRQDISVLPGIQVEPEQLRPVTPSQPQTVTPDLDLNTNTNTGDHNADTIPAPDMESDHTAIAAWIWIAGMAILAAYTTVSYLRLKRQVKDAYILGQDLFLSPGLDSAFVLGFFRPRIFLPEGLSEESQRYVVAHERAHIARKDHLWKLIGFAVLTLHWFNPLVWAAYHLMCKDIEMACDERVVRDLDVSQRKAYSTALLACAARRSGISACPVAFGETGVKQRIVNVLNYRKPGFWITLVAIAAVAAVAVCFLTNPAENEEPGETTEPVESTDAPTVEGMEELNRLIEGSEILVTVNGDQILLSEDGMTVELSVNSELVYRNGFVMAVMKQSPRIEGGTILVDAAFKDDFLCRDYDLSDEEILRKPSLFHGVIFFAEEILDALKQPDASAFNQKLLAEVLLPGSMGIEAPHVDMDRVFQSQQLSGYSEELVKELEGLGYEDVSSYTYTEYVILTGAQTLEQAGIGSVPYDGDMTVAQYHRMLRVNSRLEFVETLTDAELDFAEQKQIKWEDLIYLDQEFYGDYMSQSDEVLEKALEAYYAVDINYLESMTRADADNETTGLPWDTDRGGVLSYEDYFSGLRSYLRVPDMVSYAPVWYTSDGAYQVRQEGQTIIVSRGAPIFTPLIPT